MRHTRAWLSSETSFTFACQARASGLLLDPRKSIENDSGFGSTPGDTKQFLLTLTPAVSAGGLSLTPREPGLSQLLQALNLSEPSDPRLRPLSPSLC